MYIDFHAHILPGADHGSQNLNMSMTLLRAAAAAGVDTIVATPHFYPEKGESVGDFILRRNQAFEQLRQAVEQAPPDLRNIRVVRGAEVMVSGTLCDLPGVEQLCIEHTRYMLIERRPEQPLTNSECNVYLRLQSVYGITPVIAHIDRYDAAAVQELAQLELPMQINASGLCGFSSRRRCRRWLQAGNVCALGSDVHRDPKAYRDFQRASRILGAQAAALARTAREILANQKLW